MTKSQTLTGCKSPGHFDIFQGF